ncbi:hypothetical protein BEN49_22775 [Hymenobacter coccineus]|uniref:Uncharacterized protein n=1 Tax=Hymenobacter coccineus TaxID=1908235 RepID=A0A1G1THR1_9BACT|nr:hypothetical protein BEN49_22775 [Hymenobacter coccineus]
MLTACGQKHDGTPYGINPEKHPYGHRETAPDSTSGNSTHADGMPKGAEMNAVTNGATTGQPMSNK